MARHQHTDYRKTPGLYNLLKMVFTSDQPTLSASQDVEVVDEGDEPPDHYSSPHQSSRHSAATDQAYVKSPRTMLEKKESLLTRALRSPDLAPADRERKTSYPLSNASGHSTAELTSDGDLTSPAYSNTSSPPHLQTISLVPALEPKIVSPPSDPSESKLEADLGRKRCISFACARRVEQPKETEKKTDNKNDNAEPPKRKSALTFACPSRHTETNKTCNSLRKASPAPRPRGSPAPSSRHRLPSQDTTPSKKEAVSQKPGSIHPSGLGDFRPSEETRFHEFASSVDEMDEWMAGPTEHKEKITLNDCLKKENAIRKLGEEAEAEAMEEEQEDDGDDDAATVHDFSSDDGNESDNEAGFADSDDESDDDSQYEFWAPSTTTAATSADNMDLVRLNTAERRDSNISFDSLKQDGHTARRPSTSTQAKTSRRPINIPRPNTPDLPDSTDFVCGTLDEDRPLEAAYISCMEERRRKKHIVIPQDIDPSFPTTDPEDNEDDLEENIEEEMDAAARIEEELLRGRRKGPSRTSPRISPRRLHSPAPRNLGQVSPKRMKSPAPKLRPGVTRNLSALKIPAPVTGVNITGPVAQPHSSRTKSLPRTPNPFFTRMEKSRQLQPPKTRPVSPERAPSRGRELHTRGPVDIIQGLERKRQKRKEKFWRQHCRKAAKEQTERRTKHGKGAERMKELGLEVAERFRAYGVTKDTQLVLSV
ncbi:hypothetical protein PISL3812_07405 [Talaromyces islandicus]|uniref:Uncharacterized protein n=1 Tax=Talaromyces islandicus TaxID=28573 RepID=A0A0U1M5Q0_TALIS|nr:hypothetical protein PISL3812_07405 [Talaromyces islandicus]